jgi:hypothetical protein
VYQLIVSKAKADHLSDVLANNEEPAALLAQAPGNS